MQYVVTKNAFSFINQKLIVAFWSWLVNNQKQLAITVGTIN